MQLCVGSPCSWRLVTSAERVQMERPAEAGALGQASFASRFCTQAAPEELLQYHPQDPDLSSVEWILIFSLKKKNLRLF